MLPSSQPDNSRQNALHANDAGLQALLAAATPTDSNRSLLGIPNSDDIYGNLSLYSDPSTGLLSEDYRSHEELREHGVSQEPPSPFERTVSQQQTHARVHSEGPRSTAPENLFNQSRASAGTINPRQATQTSEPTLTHAQDFTPNFVQTLSRGSGTTFVTPESSPYLNAVDSERFDMLADMKLEWHPRAGQGGHELGPTLDLQDLTGQQKFGYPARVVSPWNASEEDLESQIVSGSQKEQRSKGVGVDNTSTHTQQTIARTRVVSSPRTPKRKRKPLSADKRDRAAKMRKLKACIRCRLLHEQCGDGDPCPSCRDIRGTAIVWTMDCFRASVSEVQVYRTAAISFPDGFPKITEWIDKSQHVVQLYNVGLTDAQLEPSKRPTFTIICRQYTDELPEKYLKKCWMSDGERREIILPKYAIKSLQRTKVSEKLDILLNANYDKLLGELGFKQDEIVSSTLTAAAWFAQNGKNRENQDMIHSALRIAVITRLISKSFNIIGSEALGIRQDDDPASPYYQRIPIPPVLDFQIDCVWMHKLDKLRKVVVFQLKRMIMKHERENWYTIFLTIMVLLSNLEFIYQHQHQQMLLYCGPDYTPSEMMESWRHSARILLTYFHAISHGNLPIVMKWTKKDEADAELDEQARAYLAKLKELVESQDELLRERAKGQPYTPLVWVSTLLLKNDGDSAPPRG